MVAPEPLRKLVVGGGDELEYQNIPEEGGQTRTGIGVGHKTPVVQIQRSLPPPWATWLLPRTTLRRGEQMPWKG